MMSAVWWKPCVNIGVILIGVCASMTSTSHASGSRVVPDEVKRAASIEGCSAQRGNDRDGSNDDGTEGNGAYVPRLE